MVVAHVEYSWGPYIKGFMQVDDQGGRRADWSGRIDCVSVSVFLALLRVVWPVDDRIE